MQFIKAIQVISEFPSEAVAHEAKPGIAGLDGCIGARVIPPKYKMHTWAVQSLHEDHNGELCDGERRVVVPFSQMTLFSKT